MTGGESRDSASRPTLAAWISRAAAELDAAGIGPGEHQARTILRSALQLKSADLLMRPDRRLTDEETSLLDDLIRSRIEGVPVQYLTGQAAFRNLDLIVGPGVFIPRPETEGLVDHVLAFLKRRFPTAPAAGAGAPPSRVGSPAPGAGGPAAAPGAPVVLDLCVGSGAVLASILSEHSTASGVGVEESRLALDYARLNMEVAGVRRRAQLHEGDLFGPLPLEEYGEAFDVIVSNPPYIPENQWENLSRDVRDFEPRLALLGGPDGLEVIRRIVAGAPEYLKEGGLLALEIDASHGATLCRLLEDSGEFEEVRVEPDLAGRTRYCLARTRLARTRRRSRSMRDGRWSNEA